MNQDNSSVRQAKSQRQFSRFQYRRLKSIKFSIVLQTIRILLPQQIQRKTNTLLKGGR